MALSHMANQYINKLFSGAVSERLCFVLFNDILTHRFAKQGILYHLFIEEKIQFTVHRSVFQDKIILTLYHNIKS